MQNFLESLKRNKILLLTVFSVCLTIILVTNLTGAFFFGSSDTYTTIVISDLNITAQILNQSGNALNITTPTLLPGEVIERTLEINNLDSSQDAYVRIQALFYIDFDESGTFEEDEQSLAVQMQPASSETDWLIGDSGPQYWYYYDNVLELDTTLTIDLEFIVFPTATNNEYGIENEDAGKPYKIVVVVNAVQLAAYMGWGDDIPTGFHPA